MKHTRGERKLKRRLQLQEQQGLEHLLLIKENEMWNKIFEFPQKSKDFIATEKRKRRGGLDI